jgi:type IV pilus assembly protein PilW
MRGLFSVRQKGVSMIELLIAVAISAFIILGITQVFIDNQRNHIYQQNQSGNQSSSRFSLLLLGQTLSKAGYRRLAQDDPKLAFGAVNVVGCPAFSEGQVIRPTTNGLGVCIRYQSVLVTDRDCQGNLIPLGSTITERLEFSPAVVGPPRVSGQLNCAVNGGAQTALSTGLNQVAFLYGVDTNDDRVADAYVAQAAVPATAVILAVRYALLHESESSEVALGTNNYFFPLSSTAAVAPLGRRIYKSVQGTSTIRNIAP